ncbi:putative 2-oxo acid decarboxylase [Thozetella sp. PMI_491]|nr:putative 2-oxo acid decarboxylase [Thozetella sp. PMI_491]
MPSSSEQEIKVGDYVFLRLHQLGIRSVFGVPGDYNLKLLDFVEPAGLHWVGNCNELNAAYAADGYARINGISALVTTFGVGELSAINGIAGAYAEKAPIIHIVGTPSRELQNRLAQSNLMDPTTAPDEIDRVLELALFHQRPVYLEIPDDMVNVRVSRANLNLKPKLGLSFAPETENEILKVQEIVEALHSAKRPVILVDGESRGLGILDQIDELITTTAWPTWTTIFGKGLIDENRDNVHGIFRGKYGPETALAYINSADLVLHFGPHLSDTNTFSFTTVPNETVTIAFSQNTVKNGSNIYHDFPTRRFLSKVLESLDRSQIVHAEGPLKYVRPQLQPGRSGPLLQKEFWGVVNSLIRPGDIVLAETGTSAYGSRTFELPPRTRLFTCVTWLSIGYMLPATLGAALAQREILQAKADSAENKSPRERVILFIGDGSLQMTAQEISTIIREKLNVTIFVINNNGYTIERVIHGRKQVYNDIAPWNHQAALNLFGQDEESASQNFFRAKTWEELDAIFESPRFQSDGGIKLVEVFLGQEDCIDALLDLLNRQILEENNHS